MFPKDATSTPASNFYLPRPQTLQRIADALGLKPYQLFVEEGQGKELEATLMKCGRG